MGQQVYETNRRNHWGKDFCVYPLPHLSAGLFRMLSFGKSQPSMKVSTSVKRGHHFLTGMQRRLLYLLAEVTAIPEQHNTTMEWNCFFTSKGARTTVFFPILAGTPSSIMR